MPISAESRDYILRNIEVLPHHRVEEIIDFIEFLKNKSRDHRSGVDESSLILQQASLNRIWEDEEDLYDF
ncbi:MAG: DUF2281 domain-containing protein [Deltaproteobacteria bacterium]|nr:DUF2281 domain-containing protein [Deltaproteobacteria bacterium]